MKQPEYEAFISYSHRDEKWAAWLHKGLETYRPPKTIVGQAAAHGVVPKRLRRVFRDRDELPSATDLGAAIGEALQRSACQIVICSPQAAQSKWVNEEILAYKRLGREARIFCLIVDGEPNASDRPEIAEQECFPPALRYKLAADGSLSDERTEPIAADARDGKDGKQNAKLKLISGMLGVGFDALKRREQQRRQRRLALIASGAVAGMVVTSGLAAAALYARANAERHRQRAEREAETARQTTGFLVDLFKISDPGEARGNSITAREMLDKGAARIQTELTEQPAIQAALMDTVGTVYVNLGLYRQAQPLLESALSKRRPVVREEPNAAIESLNHLGDLLTLQANYSEAESRYRDALSLAEQHGAAEQAVAAKSLIGSATATWKQGDLSGAEASLRRALAIQQSLYPDAHVDIAQTLSTLASVRQDQGDLEGAAALMEQSLAMQRELRGNLPHPAIAEALNNLAWLKQTAGRYDQAEALLQESLEMKRKLLGAKHPEIALALNNLAFLLHDGRQYDHAESLFKQALTMQRELLGKIHPDVAETLNNLAFLYYDTRAIDQALATERESLAIYRRLFPGDHPEVANRLNTIGGWLSERREFSAAESNLNQALGMRRRLFGDDHPQAAATRTLLAKLQLASGKNSTALKTAQAALVVLRATLPPTHWRIADAQSVEGAAWGRLGQFDKAEKLLLESYESLEKDAGVLPIYREQARRNIEELYQHWNRSHDAARFQTAASTLD